MARSKELVRASDLEFVELDGRQSGEIYYQLICNLGSATLALLGREYDLVRAVPVPSNKGNDAMAHPEGPDYLGSKNVIYGGGYEELIVDYQPSAEAA